MNFIDWGSAPAWVSSILTSGSVTLAFYVILRDRRREEFNEAKQIACWRVWTETECHTHVYNIGEKAVTDLHLLVMTSSDAKASSANIKMPAGAAVLLAGEEKTFRTVSFQNGFGSTPLFLTFQDANGGVWVNDLTDGSIRRLPRRMKDRLSAARRQRRRFNAVRGEIADKVYELSRSEDQ